ncbi:para-nitrobenzyl esterase-like [Chironomus tepperi]|uniref:para-nitrobenzyl esterase-like n=1 Tax=Chironomus tepperi TaxID=113505 RepID=UPI00391FACFD
MLKFVLLLSCAVAVFAQDRLTVTIPQGQLSGIRVSTGILQPAFWAFRGIPYAEPPVGQLRFRNPVPHRGWGGVLDASNYGPSCPHRPIAGMPMPNSNEDCLYLNVFTPSTTGNRPVMVWIHGGAFTLGDGSSQIYGPDFLVNDGGVIVVSMNYRLGIMGFLASGDAAAQGNWAMKDMIEALRWVRNNIQHFGGNPNSITVFGESAGSVSVHYLLLTQMGAGLFHRAIMQSGTANVPWGFQTDPAGQYAALGRRLGLTWSSNQDLMNQFRTLSWHTIMDAQTGLMDMPVPRGFQAFAWVPAVEPVNSPEERFLVDTPVNIMTRGQVMTVPMIIGYTSDESLFMIREAILDNTVWDQFANNPHFYVPQSYNLNPVTQSAQVNEVATTFRNSYMGGQHPHNEIRYNWTTYCTDHQFSFFVDRSVRYHVRRQTQPIYYYKFSYDGSLNMMKRLILLADYPGAMHADDIFYLFDVTNFPMPILPNNQAITIRRRMVRMWSNFATFGDPTPVTDSLITTRWARYTLDGQNYLDIEAESVNRNNPQNGRLTQWHTFQDRFNPSYPG